MDLFKLAGSIFVDNSKANESISATDKKASGLGKSFVSATKKVGAFALGVGTAAVGVGIALTKMAGDYSESFAKVNTLLTGSEEEIKAYKNAILQASKETGVATDELCESVYSSISAGLDQADAIKFATKAAKLAKGGFTDTAKAVDVMTTVMNSYGLSADEATEVSDMLVQTQNMGKTTVDELASSLGKIIPIANTNNVKFDQLSTNMAILTKNGIATSEAGTMTKAMLGELGKESSNVAGILKEQTGKSFAELSAEGVSLGDVMEILGDSVDGNSVAFANLWSSSEAGTAASTLFSQGAEVFNESLLEMQNCAGTTEEAFGIMSDTLNERVSKAFNSAKVTMIEVGAKIEEVILKIWDAVSENSGLIKAKFAEVWEACKIAFQIFWDACLKLWDDFGRPIFDAFINIVSMLKDLFLENFESIQIAFQVALEYLANIYENILKPVFDLFMHALDKLLGLFRDNMGTISSIFGDVVNTIKIMWDTNLKPVFEAIKNIIENYLKPAFDKVFTYGIVPIFNAFVKNIKSMWENSLKPIFTGICEFLNGIFTLNIDKIFSGIVNIISGAFNGLLEILKQPFRKIAELWNNSIGKISFEIPSWVPGIGGKEFGFPTIPAFAKGTDWFEGGPALVGEEGPEVVDLPKGSRVTPNHELNNLGNNNELVTLIKDLITTTKEQKELIQLLLSSKIQWNDRELARLVSEYA